MVPYMAMDETTTIEIAKSTRTRLRTWKSTHDLTYDEAINELLDGREDD